ncbi:hypothetical protein FSP39_000986, partial [Pinctada imbricata]
QIIEPKPDVKKPKMKTPQHFIFFFGSENYAWMQEEQLFLYSDHKDRFKLTKRLPRGYKEAVEAIDDELKAKPCVKTFKSQELPSIDEELAQIFPNRPEGSKQKDYTRQPLKGKKNTGSVPKKRGRPPSSDKEDRPKKAKVAKVMGSPSTASFGPEVTRIRPKVSADMSSEGLGSMAMSPPSNSYIQASLPSSPIKPSAGTQIEESILLEKSATPIVKSAVIPTPMRIGFLGLGIMGQGMVMNLLRSGHEVTVWNRTAMKCREFVKSGAFRGNNPAEVVQACDITFSCVADSTAVKDLVFGNYGVLQGITKGKCYVEMSTIDEDTMQDTAEAIKARGGVFLEAPVVGSRVPALEGQLIILAAGERKLYDECYSCFEAMGKKSLYLGDDIGSATQMKLIVNMVMGTVVASLAEGMAMAEKVGLDQEDVAEVFSLGALSCPTVIHKSQAILSQRYDPHFPLQHQQKDLRLSLLLGDKIEQPLYVASAANELFKKARRLGYGDSDVSAVYRAASN